MQKNTGEPLKEVFCTLM